MASELGQRLRRARTVAGLRARDAAALVGRTPQTIYRWEWGATSPSLRELRRLASAYGVSLAELVSDERATSSLPPCA